MTNPITVEATIHAPLETVWNAWTDPKHITQWCFASDDWEAPRAENDARTGGAFTTLMAAKDKSFSFEFKGVYSLVEQHSKIEYAMDDGRQVKIAFESSGDQTKVTETFDPESENSEEMQRRGWQAILNNFKKYVEHLSAPNS